MQSITEFAVEGGIYRPLDINSNVSSEEFDSPRENTTAGLETLEELHHHIFRILANTADPHRLARTQRLLERYDGQDWLLWKQRFSQDERQAQSYGRSAVWQHPGCFQLLILTWAPGCCSPVHNHPCERCFLMPLTGKMAEARFWVNEETKECTEICRSTLKTHKAYWIDDSHGWHAVMNLGDVDSVSLHLYIPEIIRCKIVNPRTHHITWTTCLAEGRRAPPAVHQRLLRIVATALLETSLHGDCYSGAEDDVSSISRCLLWAFRRDEDYERKRQRVQLVEKSLTTCADSCAKWDSAKAESERNKLEALFGFERNAAPLVDDAVLAAIHTIVELCMDGEETETTRNRNAREGAAGGEEGTTAGRGKSEQNSGTKTEMGQTMKSRKETLTRKTQFTRTLSPAHATAFTHSTACAIFSHLDAAILTHVVHFLRENEEDSEVLLEALTAGETVSSAFAALCASRRRASDSAYYRLQEAGSGGGEEAEEEGGGNACAKDDKWTELTRTKDCLQKLDEKLMADLFSSASPSFYSRLSSLHPRSPLDETTACQSTLCSQGDEDGAGDEEAHEGGKEKHDEAEEESGRGLAEPDEERNKLEKQEREPGQKPGGRHGKHAEERGAESSEETRQQQRNRAPLCGFWLHSEVWAFLKAIHLARHFKHPPSDAFPRDPAVNDHTQRRLKCEGLVSPSFFPACSSPGSWFFSTPVTGCARLSSGERRVYIFVCSGSPYIQALHEAFAVAGFADTGRIVAVHQNPDSGVMSVECLREKMRDVQESEREVREARDKENTASRERQREEGVERKAADKGTHEERSDEEEKGRYSFVIVASAGRSGTLGGFDDFLALRQLANETGSWLHVDGLVGGSFIFPREKPFQVLCAGMGLADSLTWSAHAFLTGSGDPASPVAFFCRQDAVPLLLSPGHLPPSPTLAVALSSPSMPSLVEEPFVLRPSQGEEIGCGFPLWCFWKKLGDTGVANRVRQVYLRCRQLSLLLSHFPKRVKPPAFPEAPKSRVATEERAYGGMRMSAFGGKQRGEGKARKRMTETGSEQRHRGANCRVEEDGGEQWRGGAEERDERRRLARASADRTSAGRGPRENLTNAQQMGEDREEDGEAESEEDEVGFRDDKPGNYDLAHKLEDDANFLRENEDAVDHLVDAAREILSRDPEAFRRPVVSAKSYAARDVPTPRMQALGRLEGGLTDSKRGRVAGVPKPLRRDLEAGRKAGTEVRGSFYTGAGASWNAEQCRMCDSSSASQLRCNATRCMYTPGAFHVKQTGCTPSFSVSFWWIPPCLRGEVLSRATFSAAACQEIRFFVTLISRLLSLLLERERAGHRSRDHDNAVNKAPKGSSEAPKDSKWSQDSEFRLSSDALSIHLVDDDEATNSAIPDDREEQEWKGSTRRPPLLSVCILDPCVGEGDLAALLCLINRLGMLLIETGKANASEGTSRLL
ncbi:UNVERIFIED_CONTAM: hypothetical protein HHA_244412 [Hammondia hammondi]|eukprot:XP_008884260.1 hypothetical protein HHA_244412 [Hammondia hammondi]